jgi:hypothetical protein
MSLGRIFGFRESTLIGDPAIQAYLFAGIGDSNRNGLRVDIQPKKSYFGHATSSIRVRLCAAGFAYSQRNPRIREQGWALHCD